MKLLITRHDKIGDFVVTLPLVKAIKEQYPNTDITVLVSKINFDFARECSFIDDVILYDKNNFTRMLEVIKSKKIEVSISAYIDTKLGLLLFLSGIKTRVAPATKIAQIFFNKRVVQRRSKVEKREWEYNLDLGRAVFQNLTNDFLRPLINIDKIQKVKRVIFHAGFGGSSDGNLRLEDYLNLARTIANSSYEIIFTFGPDDTISKKYIEDSLNFKATIIDSFNSLIEFCEFIAKSSLFVSTSTGPMHLAGAVNTKTLSFFGDSLFASPKRWGTISCEENQSNFSIPKNYDISTYKIVENRLKEVLKIEQ